jgi:TonB family protein
MRLLVRSCAIVLMLLFAIPMPAQTPDNPVARDSLNNGVRAYREGNYEVAIGDFLRALELDPNWTVAEVYLGLAYSQQFIPGNQSEQNRQWADKAIEVFERVLKQEPNNIRAADGLATIYQNTNQLQKARETYLKGTQLDPQNPSRFYAVGSIDWLMLQNKKPPLAVQQQSELVQEGLENLKHALAIDPDYEDAMAYMNLLLREQAKLETDETEKKRLIALADDWFNKVLETRKKKQGRNPVAPNPTAPPPPTSVPAPKASVQRLPYERVQGSLISRPPLQYPSEARAQRVYGAVVIEARIEKDGTVSEARVLTGHDLLAPAALENVKQWRYKPFILNGEAAPFVTTITVNFALQ